MACRQPCEAVECQSHWHSSGGRPEPGQHDRAMRRRAKPPPHPADPPTTTNRHTNAHLLSGTTTRLREVKTVVEAGRQRALTKGGRCQTVRQPLSTWAPALHRTDEPLVLCQSPLIAVIGRQRAVSTPIRETSRRSSLPAGLARTAPRWCGGRFEFFAEVETNAKNSNRREHPG